MKAATNIRISVEPVVIANNSSPKWPAGNGGPAISLRVTIRGIGEPHKLNQPGATPGPATNFSAYSLLVKAPVFQTGQVGSIPAACSNFLTRHLTAVQPLAVQARLIAGPRDYMEGVRMDEGAVSKTVAPPMGRWGFDSLTFRHLP